MRDLGHLAALGALDLNKVLKQLLGEYATGGEVIVIGLQCIKCLGRALVDGAKRVKLFGEEIAVKARIKSLHGTSGHADKEGLKNWLFQFKGKPRTVRLRGFSIFS